MAERRESDASVSPIQASGSRRRLANLEHVPFRVLHDMVGAEGIRAGLGDDTAAVVLDRPACGFEFLDRQDAQRVPRLVDTLGPVKPDLRPAGVQKNGALVYFVLALDSRPRPR